MIKKYVVLLLSISIYTSLKGQVLNLNNIIQAKCDTGNISLAFETIPSPPKASFYLMSELHQVMVNPYLQVEFVKYLSKQRNLKYIVLEMSHSNAFLYNEFLENGDTAFLRWIAYDGRHSPIYFSKLYEYNKKLDKEMKLTFLGVDVIMSNKETFKKAIKQFFQISINQEHCKKINSLFQEVALATTVEDLEEQKNKIKSTILSDTTLYAKVFSTKFDDLKIILTNISTDKGRRDDEMFDNFKNIIEIKKLNSSTSFFGSFGNSHVQLLSKKDCFRKYLEDFSFFAPVKKVSIIGVQYYNCYALHDSVHIKNDGIFSSYSSSLKRINKKDLDNIEEYATNCKSNISIFPIYQATKPALQGQQSTFSKLDYLIICKDFQPLH